MRVKINRSERRPPYLSNIVKGGAEQIQPNGCTYDQGASEPDGVQGATMQPPVPAYNWPTGNRTGE